VTAVSLQKNRKKDAKHVNIIHTLRLIIIRTKMVLHNIRYYYIVMSVRWVLIVDGSNNSSLFIYYLFLCLFIKYQNTP